MEQKKEIFADDTKESVGLLLRLRLPWLVIGLVGGSLAALLVSRFEGVIEQNVSLAFFLPIIVYMSDAVGTQTETIYVRNLAKGNIRLRTYFLKELILGISLGLIFGVAIGIFANLWLGSPEIARTVGISMFATVTTAPIVALLVPALLQKEHTDPALGGGPFTTIIQDVISLLIYFLVATTILLS